MSHLEIALKQHGFRNFSLGPDIHGRNIYIRFENSEDCSAFILKDILKKVKEKETAIYHFEPDVDFSETVEKKMKTYSKFDEFILRKFLKRG